MTKLQFHLRGNKAWLAGLIFCEFMFLSHVIHTICWSDNMDQWLLLRSVFFAIVAALAIASMLRGKITELGSDEIEFRGLVNKKNIPISSIKGFHSTKGFILTTGKKVGFFNPFLKYYPNKEFEKWIDRNFERLDKN